MKKLIRDTEMILKFARFVIVIQNNDNGLINIELIDNAWRAEQNLPYAPIIAVVGNTGILLEIGYGRARPYNQVESYTSKEPGDIRKRWCIKPRSQSAKLTPPEIQIVYPKICDCMAEIVLERREPWSTKESWWLEGPGYVDRGIRFTVSKEDRWLYRQFLLENIRYLTERKILSTHLVCIHFWVGHYKRIYSKRQLERFSGARKLTEMLGHYNHPIHQASILYLLENLREKALFQHIGKNLVWTDEVEIQQIFDLLKNPSFPKLPEMQDIRCYIPHKRQPQHHGKGCLTVEILLDERFRELREN